MIMFETDGLDARKSRIKYNFTIYRVFPVNNELLMY